MERCESLPGVKEARLRELVVDRDGVTAIIDFRIVHFDPDDVLVAADVAFDPDLDVDGIDHLVTTIEIGLTDAYDGVRKAHTAPETGPSPPGVDCGEG